MRAVAKRGGEQINVTAFAQFEAFPEFCNGGWEVADGQVALADACQHRLYVLLGKAAIVIYHESSTGKILDDMGRSEQMAERVQLPDVVGLAEHILYPSLQDGGIGLVEVLFGMGCDYGFGFSFFGTESLCLGGDVYAVVGYTFFLVANHQQHFFAFAVHTHHMHFVYIG